MKLYYYKAEQNFGDLLNPVLINTLFNIPVEYSSPQECELCAIGSILESFFTSNMNIKQRIKKRLSRSIIVWGSGFIESEQDKKYIPIKKLDVRAVRGLLTLKRIQKYLKPDNDIVLGDPGLLCSRLIDTHNIKKKYDLGIIPHYVDKNSEYLKNIKVKNSVVIDIQQPVDTVLHQIAQCKCIISSAMHGLIASDSLGIPNIRMILSDKIVGGDYKFDDYYSVFGITNHPRVIIDKNTKITDTNFIFDQYKITPQQVNEICNKLLIAFLQPRGNK